MKSSIFLLVGFIISQIAEQASSLEQSCTSSSTGVKRTLKVSIKSRKNYTGEWIDTVFAKTEINSSFSHGMDVDLTHQVEECGGIRLLSIEGVTKESADHEVFDEKLSFHVRHGKNVQILPNGLTIKKLNIDDPANSGVFTNRPLKNNEIFEMRLDKKTTKYQYSLSIGIMAASPNEIELLPSMYQSIVVWIYHSGHIYSNGAVVKNNYGRDLNNLKIGDRVGVMRSDAGKLHFFVNGVDIGPALSNVPATVYGHFDLNGNTEEATMIETFQKN